VKEKAIKGYVLVVNTPIEGEFQRLFMELS